MTDLRVDMDLYGSLLISIVFERIPSDQQIIISFNDDFSDLKMLISIFAEKFSHMRYVFSSEPIRKPAFPTKINLMYIAY